MGVKIAFVNDVIYEELYVKQSSGFKDSIHQEHVFKLKKSLYGMKQAPRAWYEKLSKFSIRKWFKKNKLTLHCS